MTMQDFVEMPIAPESLSVVNLPKAIQVVPSR